ncbi:hypothetical protein BJF90_43095 [Pseudonocardia sp. CNS-004]|nr:hypothetical protein BJF90_43095 [Pseudonocardia sp. CNS-004]
MRADASTHAINCGPLAICSARWVPRGAGRHRPDAIAFSIHTVVSGGTEMGHHVLRYLLPATPSEIDRHGPR